jgi:hypothetical protein
MEKNERKTTPNKLEADRREISKKNERFHKRRGHISIAM